MNTRASRPSSPCCRSRRHGRLRRTLEHLNNRPAYRKYFDRLAGSAPPVENAAREWQIEFHPDADGELAPGDILIHSELVLPAGTDDLGAGQRTRRITTVHVGHKTTKREETVSRTMTASVHRSGAPALRGQRRTSYLRHRSRLDRDRARRHRLPGRRANRRLGRRLAGARAHSPRPAVRRVFHHRSQHARDDA